MIRHLRESAASLLRRLLTVDGAGSGLDADLVDGSHLANVVDHPGIRAAAWYTVGYVTGISATTLLVGHTHFAPVHVPHGATINRLSFEVTTAGAAGTGIKMALYSNVSGTPTNLIQDFGAFAADALGVNEATLAAPLMPGWYHVCLNASATVSVRYQTAAPNLYINGASSFANNPSQGLRAAHPYTLPFPNPMTGVISLNQNSPLFYMRSV